MAKSIITKIGKTVGRVKLCHKVWTELKVPMYHRKFYIWIQGIGKIWESLAYLSDLIDNRCMENE